MEPSSDSRASLPNEGREGREARFVAILLLALGLATFAGDRAWGPPPEPSPTSDLAVLELGVRLAAEGAQRLGPEARFHFQHPGPAAFYFAVPFYTAMGQDARGLGAAALAWNLLALAVFAWAAGRLLGPGRSTLACALALGFVATRGLGFLLSFWNANLPVLPFAASLAAAALVAAGEAWALALVALFGSLAVQTHAVYLVPVGLVTLTAIAALAGRGHRTPGRRLAGALASTLGVVVLLWALPFWDEWAGEYHNLHRLLGTGGQPRTNGWAAALAASSRALLGFAGVGRHDPEPLWSAPTVIALGLVAAFAAAAIRARRDRSCGASSLATVTTAALAAVALTARAAPGAIRFPYVLHWAAFAGAAAALVVGSVLLGRSARGPALFGGLPGRVFLGAACLALLLVRLHGFSSGDAPPRDPGSVRVERASREILGRLDAAWRGLPPAARPRVLLRVGDGVDRDEVVGLVLALDKAGVRFAVEPFGAYRFVGHLRPTGRERGELIVGARAPGAAVERLSSEPGLSAVLAAPDAVAPGRADPRE